LDPIKKDPPCTREKEEKLIKQALKTCIALPKETDRKKEHITGIITSDSAIEKIKVRPDLVQPGTHKRGWRSITQLLLLLLTAKIPKMRYNLVCKVRNVVGIVRQLLLLQLTAKIQYNLVCTVRSVAGTARQFLPCYWQPRCSTA